MPFKEYAEEWRALQAHRKGTADQVRINLERHVYPTFGPSPDRLYPNASHIQALVAHLNQTLAPATVEVVMAWVRTIFKSAVMDRKIPASPCVDLSFGPWTRSG